MSYIYTSHTCIVPLKEDTLAAGVGRGSLGEEYSGSGEL